MVVGLYMHSQLRYSGAMRYNSFFVHLFDAKVIEIGQDFMQLLQKQVYRLFLMNRIAENS